MEWNRLISLKDNQPVKLGSVFRFPAKYPYEDIVDFMVFKRYERKSSIGFMVSSGYNSGLISIILSEGDYDKLSDTISIKWLKENWSKWVYDECDIKDVYISSGYPIPSTLKDKTMKWKKLVSLKKKYIITTGMILRFPIQNPYEKIKEIIACTPMVDGYGRIGFLSKSGDRVGEIKLLPKESSENYVEAIDFEWLKENWSECMGSDCNIEDVYISRGLSHRRYTTPKELPNCSD